MSKLSIGLVVVLSASAVPAVRLAAQTLDVDALTMTFEDRFETLSVSAHGPDTTWTAHTPWHGDFGDARFEDPSEHGPFSLGPGGLRITAARDAAGHWHSGLICSVDKDGPGQHGFTQMYGYFEMSAKLPSGAGVWPAFWLIGADKRDGASEVDVLEFFGAFPGYYHSWLHLFRDGHDVLSKDHVMSVPPGHLSAAYNTYGVSIESDTTRFYFNRRQIWQVPTPAAYRQPMYILADLAMGGGWPIAIDAPAVMDIAYIRAYRSTGAAVATQQRRAEQP